MTGGIFVVAAYPSKLTADALANLAKAISNSPETTSTVRLAGYVGAAGSGLVAVVLVGDAGVAGLSAAGIVSGLAALGGTVLGGLSAIATGGVVITVIVGGIAYLIMDASAQRELDCQRKEIIELAIMFRFEISI